jgi:eukaryotic-like serine/threonine-protein kinase
MNAGALQQNGREAHLTLLELRRLLAEETAPLLGDATASHLDHCTACQERLTSLAAEERWWNEARTMLDSDSEPRWEPDLSSAIALAPERETAHQSLHESVSKLLAAPSHPEMLGRLGRYDIERVIGSGGMGIVLKAHDCELNRPIAIKLLAPHLAHVGAARERFAREGRAAAAVVHEHVVAIYNVESDGKAPFLVMQYVPGRSLQTRVDEDGPLSVEEILRIGMQAASGLAAAHRQGLVHRDVKPANILLENQVERAILTDFGLARTIDDASLTQTGILAGTPHYMSPEQARGEPIDFRSDLFSLGAVLYFMATGHQPFRAPGAMAVLQRLCHEKHRPVWRWNKDLPWELSELIDRLLEKKPSRRYTSADEVQHELAALLSRVQQQGRGRRLFAAWRSRRWRRRALGATLGVAAFVAAIAAVIAWDASTPSRPHAPDKEFTARTIDAATAARLDAEFFDGLEEATNSLEQLGSETRFLQHGDSDWHDAVNALSRDLSHLESNH